MVPSRSTSRLIAAVALLVVTGGPLAAAPSAAQRVDPPVDLAAITLTTADLEAAGLEGYGVLTASPYDLETVVQYVGGNQELDVDEVEATFEDAGFVGGYAAGHERRTDESGEAAPSTPPDDEVDTAVYLFEDETGAEDAFELVADAGEPVSADEPGGDLGDEAALTLLGFGTAEPYALPLSQLQLEVRSGRVIVEVSALEWDADLAADDVDEAQVETLAALADSLLDRADDALDGDAPGLEPMLVEVESDAEGASFRVYDLIDEEPIRLAVETAESFEDRSAGELDRGTVSVVRNQQFLGDPRPGNAELRLYNTILRFQDEDTAVVYMDGLVERLGGNGVNQSAEVLDEDPGIGDESLGVVLVRDDAEDGRPYDLNELFVRVGDTVGVIYVDQSEPITAAPEVPLEALIPLGEAQADCFAAGACDGPYEVPDELAEILAGR